MRLFFLVAFDIIWSLTLITFILMIHPWYLNLSFWVLLKISALYLFNQSVLNNKVLELGLITCRGIWVYISAITTRVFITTSTMAWDFSSIVMTSFLSEDCHLSPKACANNLITTDIYASISIIASMLFPLTRMYTHMGIYCRVFSYSFVILT